VTSLRKGDTWDAERGGVRLLSARCSTCVFRPGNLMHLRRGRLRDLADQHRQAGSYLVCHETLREVSPAGEALCRGFYDLPHPTQFIQVGDRLGWWVLTDPPAPQPCGPSGSQASATGEEPPE
jgi:hypothetical protein